jgi:spermidine synthase
MKMLVYSLFFVSGAAGLAFETLWGRYLSLTLGHTAHAYAAVMAAFLGGLALGNAWLAPYADRSRNRLRFYAWLELGVGTYGLLSPFLLLRAHSLLSGALILLPPTILMGGTLPALTRFAVETLGEVESTVSALYAVNGAGAALGALLTGFILIARLGLDLSTTTAAAASIFVGILCLGLSRRIEDEPRAAKAHAKTDAPARGLYLAVFASGFVSLCYEVAWTRLLALVLGSSAYSFTLMLAAFIGGISIGSYVVSRRKQTAHGARELFAYAELGVALSLAATLPLYPRLPYFFLKLQTLLRPVPETFYAFQAVQFSACFLLTLLPAAFIGATLPLAVGASVRRVGETAREVGRIFAWNTLGNVLGAVAAGLWLMPLLGLQRLIQCGLVVNCLIGALLLARKTRGVAFAAVGVLVIFVAGSWDPRVLASAPYRERGPMAYSPASYAEFVKSATASSLEFYREDADASVAVMKTASGELSLRLNGKPDASTGGDMLSQMLLGHLPLLLKPDAKTVFMVGMGSGISAGAALRHPIERLDLAEISRSVADASRLFAAFNHSPLEDARFHVAFDDAKSALRASPRRYDVVISEPSNPWIAGIGGLFTVEFYAAVADHLNKGGVMAQWFHLYSMTDPLLESVLRSFRTAFPYATVWTTYTGDVILIGSREPLNPDFDAMEKRIELKGVKADLKSVKLGRLTSLLSLQMASDPQVRWLLDSSELAPPLNSDFFPWLEFEAPKAFYLTATAGLFAAHDQRFEGDPRGELYWTQALRGRALTKAEADDLADFHSSFPSTLATAAGALVGRAASPREWDLDLLRLRPLLQAHPRDPAALSAAANALSAQYFFSRSYLKPSSPAEAAAVLLRLKAAGGSATQIDQQLAALYADAKPAEALACLERVGAFFEENHARVGSHILTRAAQLALKGGDVPRALGYARRAVSLDAADPGAGVLFRRLSHP